MQFEIDNRRNAFDVKLERRRRQERLTRTFVDSEVVLFLEVAQILRARLDGNRYIQASQGSAFRRSHMERTVSSLLADKEGVVMMRSMQAKSTDPIAPVAIDDPVPAGSSVSIERPECVVEDPHAIELAVRKRLSREDGIRFMELVVRRMPDGICLDGVVHTQGRCPDVAKVVREIVNVERVVNHLLVLPSDEDQFASKEDWTSFE